jgi:hypothetical protein
MTENTKRTLELLVKFLTPILLSFCGWVFFQFWEATKELKEQIHELRFDVMKYNEECRVATIRLENDLNLHKFKHEQARQ